MTEQPKLCKNCLHYKKNLLGHLLGLNTYDSCHNPIISGDLVTGSDSISCVEARGFEFDCGRGAKYFEQFRGDKK